MTFKALAYTCTSTSMISPRHLRIHSEARSVLRRYRSLSSTGGPSSVNASEIAFFSRLSSKWWDEQGEFAMLHKMNPTRMRFIREKTLEVARENQFHEDDEEMDPILQGLDILDVGCGGGLLSESLTRLGARTTGIDASESNIAIARTHASRDSSLCNLTYKHTPAEALLADPKQYDVVCSMEVLEHVDNPAHFLETCSSLLKPGGHLFLSTIARTPLSYFLTIFAAEHVLRMVSPGTHTYSKFINPHELLGFFKEKGWISRLYDGQPARTESEIRGMIYTPWTGSWALTPRGSTYGGYCNYIFWVRKPMT